MSTPLPLKSPLFRDISLLEGTALMKRLGATFRQIGRGVPVLREGQLKRNIGILVSGKLEIFETDAEGRRSMVGFVNPSESFALVFAFGEVERHPASVVATEDSEILVIPIANILPRAGEPISATHRRFIRNLLAETCEMAWALRSRAFVLSRRTTTERLMTYLREQRHAKGTDTFAIPFNRQELADFLCVDRSALSKILGDLQRDGLLKFRKNVFTLKS